MKNPCGSYPWRYARVMDIIKNHFKELAKDQPLAIAVQILELVLPVMDDKTIQTEVYQKVNQLNTPDASPRARAYMKSILETADLIQTLRSIDPDIDK